MDLNRFSWLFYDFYNRLFQCMCFLLLSSQEASSFAMLIYILLYIYKYISLLCEGKSWKHGATPAWMPMGQALPSISASIVASDRNSMEKHWSLSFCAQLTLPGRDLSSQTYVLTWSARKFLLHYSKAYRPLVAELFEFAKKLATIAEAKEQSIYSNH